MLLQMTSVYFFLFFFLICGDSNWPVYSDHLGFPGGTVIKSLPADAGDARDVGSIPVLGRSPGVGNGKPLQCSCLGNPIDRRAWWAVSMGSKRVRHSWATEHAHTHIHNPITQREAVWGVSYKQNKQTESHMFCQTNCVHILGLLLSKFSDLEQIPDPLRTSMFLSIKWELSVSHRVTERIK